MKLPPTYLQHPKRARKWRGFSLVPQRAPASLLVKIAIVLSMSMLCGVACEEQAAPPRSSKPPTSVVLIGVDTLRADHLGLYGAQRPTSPFLDEIAAGAHVFEWAFATSPWTLPSFASMLTGLDPASHGAGAPLSDTVDSAWKPSSRSGIRKRTRLDPSVQTLAEQLANHGMSTLAVVQNPHLDPTFELNRGFGVYDFDGAVREAGRRADRVVDRAFELVDAAEREPFFLFVQFQDPHLTYDAPPPFRGMFTEALDTPYKLPVEGVRKLRKRFHEMPPAERNFIEAAYDEEIAFVDSQIRRLTNGLKERGLDRDTLVIVSADHGEEFLDHGGFEHGHSNFNELLRVPLIAWGAGVQPGRVSRPVSVADIPATILDALGLPVEGEDFGISLWPILSDARGPAARRVVTALGDRLVLADGALYGPALRSGIRWPHKVIERPNDGRLLLFDLADDPAERSNLSDSHADIAAALQAELQAAIEVYGADTRRDAVHLNPETEERLKALGYVE